MNLALFDFDGTITTRDSLPDFIKYAVGKPAYYIGLTILSPMLAAFLGGFLSNHVAKQKMMGWFFKNWEAGRFQSVAERYSRQKISAILRPEAVEKIEWHQQRGDRVIVVSASMEDWMKPWCEMRSLELLSTRLEVEQGMLTGKFATANCHGKEKVNRIRCHVDLDDFEKIYAYGDTDGDREMLMLADEAFYKGF